MKSKVQRFRLEPYSGPRDLILPVGAEFLGAAYFNGAPAVWVKGPHVEPNELERLETRKLFLVMVGQAFEDALAQTECRFLGAAVPPSGSEILVFEVVEKGDRK